MQKFLRKFAVLLMAVVATVCTVAFIAACDKNDGEKSEYATTTFTVIVQDENGNVIDGTTFGINDVNGTSADTVKIQVCAVNGDGTLGTCLNTTFAVNAEGKATVDLSLVKTLDSNKFELHVMNVQSKGYTKGENTGDYGRYEVDKVPLTITVKLKKSA